MFDFCSFVYGDVFRTSGEQILSGPAHREDSLGFDCEEGCRVSFWKNLTPEASVIVLNVPDESA